MWFCCYSSLHAQTNPNDASFFTHTMYNSLALSTQVKKIAMARRRVVTGQVEIVLMLKLGQERLQMVRIMADQLFCPQSLLQHHHHHQCQKPGVSNLLKRFTTGSHRTLCPVTGPLCQSSHHQSNKRRQVQLNFRAWHLEDALHHMSRRQSVADLLVLQFTVGSHRTCQVTGPLCQSVLVNIHPTPRQVLQKPQCQK